MEEKELKIFIEQLKGGTEEDLELIAPSHILQIKEEELSFADPIKLSGKAYTTSTDLVIHLHCKTKATLPCSICNEKTTISLDTEMECHTFDLAELKSTIFDYTDLVREEILLRVPQFVECNSGQCPERAVLNKYAKKPDTGKRSSESVEYPFAHLK